MNNALQEESEMSEDLVNIWGQKLQKATIPTMGKGVPVAWSKKNCRRPSNDIVSDH